MEKDAKKRGIVYLVGAGPGDLGLLTVRGAELLGRADVVVYDALINIDMLRLVRAGAELIYGGKRAKDHAIPQEEMNQLLIRKAKEGKVVVRLKGGDPYIFGRGAEEAEQLHLAGVKFEVVPGISSVVAAPAYAGIPLTHRAHCSSFTVVTGHEDPSKEGTSIDWSKIAGLEGSKVVLMGVERIGEIAAELVAGGMDKETPVALVRCGTTGRQQALVSTLGAVGQEVKERQFKAPAVTVIGAVVGLRGSLDWFEKRPLFGQRIVVTRTREQASQLSRQLREDGADVMEIPTIKIVAPDRKEPLKDALLALHEYDWIVFTSPNGVKAFFDYFLQVFDDLRDLGGMRIAAVGPATAARLKELHLKVDVMPEEYLSSKIAEALAGEGSVENLRILLMRAEVADPDLPKALQEMGAIVDDVPCYKTVAESEDPTGAAERFWEEGADWVTFTSSSTVEHFHNRFDLGKVRERFPKIRFASIGPETSKKLRSYGLEPDVEAKAHTIAGLAGALRAGR